MRINQIQFNIYKGKAYGNKKINFKGFDCPQDSFEVKKLYDVPCPVCNVVMIKGSQIDGFIQNAVDKTGQDLIDILEKYRKYYHENESKAVDDIIETAKKYENKNISELLEILAQEKLYPYKKQQVKILKNIKNKIEKAKEPKSELLFFIDKQIELIYHDKFKTFKKESFRSGLITLLKDFSDKKRKERILLTLGKLRNIPQNLRFIDKNYKKDQKEILLNLVLPSKITLEHIKPRSKGGKDNTANYLAQCSKCNSQRENRAFRYWVQKNPNFKENFIKYLNAIHAKIVSHELPKEYENYPYDIITTVYDETQSAVNLKNMVFPSDEKETKCVSLENIEQKLLAKKKTLQELSAKEVELNAEENYQFLIQQEFLKKEASLMEINIQKLAKNLKEKQNDLRIYDGKAKNLQMKTKERNTKTLTKKEEEMLDFKIEKLNRYFEEFKREDLVKNIQEAQEELNLQIRKKEELENKLDKEKCTKAANELREKYTFLNISEKISELRNEIACIEAFIRDYKNKAIAFEDLIELISMI